MRSVTVLRAVRKMAGVSIALVAERLQDLEAVRVGQHDVEDHEVEGRLERETQARHWR